jgi:hypothetical protein
MARAKTRSSGSPEFAVLYTINSGLCGMVVSVGDGVDADGGIVPVGCGEDRQPTSTGSIMLNAKTVPFISNLLT